MKAKILYVGFCFLGTVLPYSQLIVSPRIRLGSPALLRAAVLESGGWLSSAWTLSFHRSYCGSSYSPKVAGSVPIAPNLAGVSLGLPLFLYMREARRETSAWALNGGAP